MGSARSRNDERIGSRQAGPAGRQKAHAAIRISVKDTILTELSILSRQFECLTTQRMIGVGPRLYVRPNGAELESSDDKRRTLLLDHPTR